MLKCFSIFRDAMNYPFISKENPLILASASPRRKSLLTQIGISFRSVTSHVVEDGVMGDPSQVSCFLAEKKAADVYKKTGPSWVLGADTMVVIENEILGKPEDKKEAECMLNLLNGKEHRVVTGFCLVYPSGITAHLEAVSTLVRMKKLTAREITSYIRTGEPFGKAGAYAIQGIGSFMVETISGSYTNVVGMPLCALTKAFVLTEALMSFPP